MDHTGKQIKLEGDMWWGDESAKQPVTEFSYYEQNFSFKVPSPRHEGGMYSGRCRRRDSGEYHGQIMLNYRGQDIRGHASCHIAEHSGIYHLHGMFTLDDGHEQMWHAKLHKVQ